MINWSKLQPYRTTKSKSFEQLCYQITSRKYHTDGILTPIDDSGGGDGVEFYLTFPDGSELGWQAKYYEGSARLNVSNRKTQITKSLEQAINKHPDLKMWILCLPMDLTKEEKIWLDNEFAKYVPAGRTIEFEFWGETFLHEKINHPDFNGIKQSFFNELELSQSWFQSTFDKSFSLVKNKYDDLLYTHNDEFEYYYVHPILCNQTFVKQRIQYYPRKLKELYLDAKEKLNRLNFTNDLWRPFFKEFVSRYTEFNEQIEKLLPAFEERVSAITPNTVFKIDDENFESELVSFTDIQRNLEDFRINWIKQNNIDLSNDPEKTNFDELKRLSPVESIYREFIEELKYFVSHSRIPLKSRISHYLGNGGDWINRYKMTPVYHSKMTPTMI